MDIEELKRKAIKLESLLMLYYKHSDYVLALYQNLRPLIEKAKDKNILKPISWDDVPGGWYIAEGVLRDIPELEAAYTDFKVEVTDMEDEISELFKDL